ncbi:DUF2971 domain-containing protein [Flavobacterium sufflavum]|uniref:DUF2971 domain-containing protein n=1 Tax=Flavobacterium sufflavum TaxID=1921138 RepID=A0A3S2UPB7_9FLAO|nr:DUF2971 domain-containing protein [Flavobacterium sufflavum]RVT76442.1 DUF2971 domain-containing protein [Flavobacterium sufflavum]
MKPENYPEIIYKYRCWSNQYHQNILHKNQVYLSAPKHFNDPFDFRISKNYLLLDSQEKIKKFVDDGLKEHKEWLIHNGKNIDYERALLMERLQNLEQYQTEYEVLENEETDKSQGVLSLSAKWDSILMWSHYGDFHKGFNIGFSEDKMRKSGLFGKGGQVIYSESFPVIDPFTEFSMETSFLQTHYKAKEWEYEAEYRLGKLYYPVIPSEEDRTITVPEECIVEINLGISISEKDRNEILEITRQRNIKTYQLKKVPFKFELTRTQL